MNSPSKSPNRNNEGNSKRKINKNNSSHLSITKNNEENDSTYKNLLEKKIKNQAERLYELQKYKDILEQRILELNPQEILPLDEDKLGKMNETPLLKESIKYNVNESDRTNNKSKSLSHNQKFKEYENKLGNRSDTLSRLQNVFLKFKY